MQPEVPPVSRYLSVCAIYRDEGPYLREWIEFHRLVGVERFFLYDNGSQDGHLDVLRPYIDEGTVVLHPWPLFPGQRQAYRHCLSRHGRESRWIAFIDLDEFLFSPTGRPVSEVLVDYESWPGVGVNWAVFGTSGHRARPSGPVIENYLYRTEDPQYNRWIRCVVDPSRVTHCRGPHFFLFDEGHAVDEEGRPIAGPRPVTETVTFARLRVNHYRTKSEEEFRERAKQYWPGTRAVERPDYAGDPRLNERYDDSILIYAPALREALGRAAPEKDAVR
jgi:Glycosyltransferase family 92